MSKSLVSVLKSQLNFALSERNLKIRGVVEQKGRIEIIIEKRNGDNSVEMEDCHSVHVELLSAVDNGALCGKLIDDREVVVSSPGIEPQIFSVEHFWASVGWRVSLRKSDGTKSAGRLVSFDGETLVLIGEDNQPTTVKVGVVTSAQRWFDWA